jgi:hypothetical protein
MLRYAMSTTCLSHITVSVTSEEDISLCSIINVCLCYLFIICTFFNAMDTAILPVALVSPFIMKGLSSYNRSKLFVLVSFISSFVQPLVYAIEYCVMYLFPLLS